MLDLLTIFDKPSMMHAAVVHIPIALIFLGVPLLILSGILHRNNTLRVMTFVVFAIAAVAAYMAEETGEEANRLVPLEIPASVSAIRDQHMELGEKVPLVAAVTAVLVLLSLVPLKEARTGFLLLALVAAIMGSGLTAYTAHLGGELVYDHGVGTPHMQIHTNPPTPTAEPAAALPAPTPTTEPPAEALVPIRAIDLTEAKQISYVRDIVPIMEEYCLDCHENPDADGNYDVTTVANLHAAGDKAGPGIIPGDPDQSAIVKYIRGELQPRMPKKKKPLSEETLHTIRLWIAAGAVDDSAGDVAPLPEPAEAAPASVMLNTGELGAAE